MAGDSFEDNFYGTVVVGERGQVVVPKEARKALRIEAGDKLIVMSRPGGALVFLKAEAMRDFARKILQKV